MLALTPFGIFAQSSQDVYAYSDEILNNTYAEAGSTLTNENENRDDVTKFDILTEDTSAENMFIVTDLLLADPNFDVQEDMISYTKDQKTVYFSANRKIKFKKGNQADIKIKKSVQLQLFKASVTENGDWENLEMLPFNSSRFSNGFPALNENDTKLYFVSDGPESTGKTDIFSVDLLEDGTYGQPKNLGSKINTEEREVMPYVDDNSVLYFASDIESEGDGLSVFASKVVDSEVSTPIKLDISTDASKEDYTTAYKAVEIEALRIAAKEADLRDLEILLEGENLAEIDRIEKTYSQFLRSDAYDFSENNVVYSVQIGAFRQNVKTGTYNKSSGLFNHRYDDGYNRFYSGVFESYEKALTHMEQMKKDGYGDAFVIGLKGEKRFLPE